MSRFLIPLPAPNTIEVIGENGKALGDLLSYSLVDVKTKAEFTDLLEKMSPKGSGFYIPEVIGVFWVDEEEAFVFNYAGHPELPIPDYPNLDIWNVRQESAFGGDLFEIEGLELRLLFEQAYQIYLGRGLIKDLSGGHTTRRRVLPDDVSEIRVTDDPGDIITNFLMYAVGSVAEGKISLDELLSRFTPDGEGFSIPELLSVNRVKSAEDSYKKSWPLNNPDIQLPDYLNKDYWNIVLDGAHNSGTVEIEGNELRRLINEAYQVYLDRGLVKYPASNYTAEQHVVSDEISGIRVTNDPGNILTHFLVYSVGSVADGEISLDDLLSKFTPGGEGFSIPTLLSVHRVESAEDSYKKDWPLINPEIQLPDYTIKDYWNIYIFGAHTKGELEIEGDELRRLIHEAYQVYKSIEPVKIAKQSFTTRLRDFLKKYLS